MKDVIIVAEHCAQMFVCICRYKTCILLVLSAVLVFEKAVISLTNVLRMHQCLGFHQIHAVNENALGTGTANASTRRRGMQVLRSLETLPEIAFFFFIMSVQNHVDTAFPY